MLQYRETLSMRNGITTLVCQHNEVKLKNNMTLLDTTGNELPYYKQRV